jgi:RsiW-degrading membrane proteinase PrsW (M82 family)
MLPTVILLGSFLVPVTAVVWYLDHDPSQVLTPRRVLAAFLVGGTIGVIAASVLEYFLVIPGLVGVLEIGLIEELVKIAAVVLIAWHLPRYVTKDGIVLGATVGFGFAALESSGYALVSLFVVHGGELFLSLGSLLVTELIRAILAPFGHGLWTGLLAGVLFRHAQGSRLKVTARVIGTYLLVSILHAAFDAGFGIVGYVLITLIALVPLVILWRRSGRDSRVGPSHLPAPEPL